MAHQGPPRYKSRMLTQIGRSLGTALGPTSISRRSFNAGFSAVLASTAGCEVISPSLNYELRISLIIGAARYVGNSVIRTFWTNNGPFANHSAISYFTAHVWGQAVIVDLAQHGMLFALLLPLGGNAPNHTPFDVERIDAYLRQYLPPNVPKRMDSVEPLQALKTLSGEYDVARWTPSLVRFRDLPSPRSAEEVDPARLSSLYGAGARVESVTVRVTSAAPTTGIQKMLPWLAGSKDPFSPRNPSMRDVAADQLYREHFIRRGD